MKVAVITDNLFLLKGFLHLLNKNNYGAAFDFFCSTQSFAANAEGVKKIKLKEDYSPLLTYDLVLSLHCKQIFPPGLIEKVRCINIHPGLNPYNRGWFPQVFSILNKMPAGVTIHEIDNEIDHGPVIVQQEIKINSWDTSGSVYNRILDTELELIEKFLPDLIFKKYTTSLPADEGNLNLKKDFDLLCELPLSQKATYAEVIDKLRALTHGGYQNAFYIDSETGKKVVVSVSLTVSEA